MVFSCQGLHTLISQRELFCDTWELNVSLDRQKMICLAKEISCRTFGDIYFKPQLL